MTSGGILWGLNMRGLGPEMGNLGPGMFAFSIAAYIIGRVIMGHQMDALTPSESFYGFTQIIRHGRAANLLKLNPYPVLHDVPTDGAF